MPKTEGFIFGKDRITMRFKNTGQMASSRIRFYYTFEKNEPDQKMGKKDLEAKLLDKEPIVRKRLVVPDESIRRDLIIDKSVLKNYEDGFAIFLHILARYKFAGGDNEREGSYTGIFNIQKLSAEGGYNVDIEQEWAE